MRSVVFRVVLSIKSKATVILWSGQYADIGGSVFVFYWIEERISRKSVSELGQDTLLWMLTAYEYSASSLNRRFFWA